MSKVVVADAGPLHYLILVDCADTLEKLFDQVLIPEAVRFELLNDSTPQKVKAWMSQSKVWWEVREVKNARLIPGLHPGEIEALQLALETKAAGVLMDDLDGRNTARSLGLTVIGTLGLLERAAEKELVNLPDVIGKLQQTNFFASPELFEAVLQRDRQRKNKSHGT